MAASSRKSFAGQGNNVHRTLCIYGPIFLVILTLLKVVPVMGGIPGILPANLERYPHSAEVGKKGLLVYILDSVERPEHLCVATDYNCTTPHGLCIDRNDKYRFVVVESEVFEDGRYQWLCGLEINRVTVDDVGKYEIWKRFGIWNAGFHNINFAVWERDNSGRICQTSYDETSKKIVNNCTSLTTRSSTATTGNDATTPATPSGVSITTNNTTTEDRSEIRIDPRTTEKPNNEAQPGKLSSTVGIPVTVVIIVIVIIGGVVYLYKKQSRSRQNVYYTPAAVSPSTNGPTATVTINMKSADGCSNSENAHLKEDPNSNT